MNVQADTRPATLQAVGDLAGNPERCSDRDALLLIADCVRDLVEERVGRRPLGPVRLLTHLRYAGYVMNPLSLFYCFDASGRRVEAVVAEVTNTPWGERYCYVLGCEATRQRKLQCLADNRN